MKRRRYTLEFKESAVRQMILDGKPAVDLADELGLNTGLLYRWKQELIRAGKIKSVQSQSVDLSEVVAENARLRKELNRAREINAVLKKTVGYFSNDPKGDMSL